MYFGDRSRKETLVEYGFRLPSALDNRPLNFDEFERLMPANVICTSATPGDYELNQADGEVVEQVIRPTGLLDPVIEVRKPLGQIDDIMQEIKQRIEKNERVMIVTLTIRMAEDLTAYLKGQGIKVTYLQNETKNWILTEREPVLQIIQNKHYNAAHHSATSQQRNAQHLAFLILTVIGTNLLALILYLYILYI